MMYTSPKKPFLLLTLALCLSSQPAKAEDPQIFDADAMRAEFGTALKQDSVLGNQSALEMMGVLGNKKTTPATADEIMEQNAPKPDSTQIGPGFSLNNPDALKAYMDSAAPAPTKRKYVPPKDENDLGETFSVWSEGQEGYANPTSQPGRSVSQNLLSQSQFNLNLVRPDTKNPDEFTIRFSQPASTSGCMNIAIPDPQIVQRGKTLWITVGSPVVGLDSSARYTNYDCQQNTGAVKSDVTLSRKKLAEQKIEKLYFKNDYGLDAYTIALGEDNITLAPKTKILFKPNDALSYNGDPLQFWFYPENTLILRVPYDKADDKIGEQINKLALSKGLINLKSVVKGFDRERTGQNNFYFVDPAGTVVKALQRDKGVPFGKVKVTESFYGPQGTYEEPRTLPVFAKLPGALE